MGRRSRQSMIEDIFDTLKVTPIWVGPILAVVVFLIFRFIPPLFFPGSQAGLDTNVILRPLFASLAWALGGVVLLAWGFAEIWKLLNGRLLDGQTGIASIKNMSWQEFERLVCEAYRRKGYTAELVGNSSGDGGVDIQLYGREQKVLVQCKQWKAFKVGVKPIRELLGVVVSDRADRGIVVTSGRFTIEAKAFARRNPQIELVDGPELAELIRGVQSRPSAAPPQMPTPSAPTHTPACPHCGSGMVLRTARKGQNTGSQFWGCPKYPACRGTRPV